MADETRDFRKESSLKIDTAPLILRERDTFAARAALEEP
jgi:hypothetical protein